MGQTDEQKRVAFEEQKAKDAREKELARREAFQKAREEAIAAFNKRQPS